MTSLHSQCRIAGTIPTSAAKEDHVSMGGWAARKALQVVEHIEMIVAIELLCAAQALGYLHSHPTTSLKFCVH